MSHAPTFECDYCNSTTKELSAGWSEVAAEAGGKSRTMHTCSKKCFRDCMEECKQRGWGTPTVRTVGVDAKKTAEGMVADAKDPPVEEEEETWQSIAKKAWDWAGAPQPGWDD